MEWAQVRTMAADGGSQREMARRLGLHRRTVARRAASDEPPRYRREPTGSQLDAVEPALRELVAECPARTAPRATEIVRERHVYAASVEPVKRRLHELRPRSVRPTQRTGSRP